jgi:hypothetical protein
LTAAIIVLMTGRMNRWPGRFGLDRMTTLRLAFQKKTFWEKNIKAVVFSSRTKTFRYPLTEKRNSFKYQKGKNLLHSNKFGGC